MSSLLGLVPSHRGHWDVKLRCRCFWPTHDTDEILGDMRRSLSLCSIGGLSRRPERRGKTGLAYRTKRTQSALNLPSRLSLDVIKYLMRKPLAAMDCIV